ncbi:hypothetical protein BGW38_010356 [Lunasporangiospora selenospora]|uniref:Uncharacterized protein n=1 Tax=Lunasporangiospora selenospora TaxID=979761 RepID=A0A9P6G2R8_9FUNG|nr:hypothetical protein BGW38_010356 [Lunasporangiospora selenospora]
MNHAVPHVTQQHYTQYLTFYCAQIFVITAQTIAEGTLVGSEDSDTESLFFGSRLDQIKDGFSLALTGDSASSSSIPSMSAPFGSTAAISAAVSAVASGDDAVYNRICNALQGLIAEAQTALLRGTSSTLLPHQQPQSQHSQSQQAGPSVYSKRQTCTHYTDATGEGRGSLCTTSRQDSFIEVLATSPTALSESEADPTTRSRASSVTSSIHSSFSGSITSLAHSTRPVPLSRATLQVPSTGALGAAATTAGRMSPMSRSMSASSRKEFSKILWKEKQQEQYERYRRSCDQVSLELETLLNNAMKMSNEDNDEDSDRGSNYYHNYFSRWSDENRSQGSAHEAHELEYDPVNDAKKSTKSEAQAISLSESESMVGDMNKPFTMDYHKESIEAESDISAAESSYQSARLLAASLKSSALSLPSRLLSSRVNSPLPTSDADVEASLSPVVQDGSIVEETTKSKVLFMHRQYQMQLMQEGGIAGTQHRQRQCAYDTEDEDSGLELLDENRAESSSLSSWGSRSGPLVDSGPFYDHRYQLFDPSKHQRHSLEVHAKQSTRQPRHRHQSQHASEQNVDSHLPQRRQVRNQGVGASRSNSLLMQLYGLWTQTWLRRRIMHVLAGTIEFSVAALIVLKASESILSWAGVSTPGGGIQDWLHSLVSGSIRHTTSSAASAAAKTGSVAGTGGAGFARELYEKILKDGMIIKKANGGGEHHPRGPGVASLLRSALITATTVAATSPSSASTTAQLGLETAQQQAATRTPFTATAMVLAPTVRIVTQILVGFLVAHIVDQVRRLRKKF